MISSDSVARYRTSPHMITPPSLVESKAYCRHVLPLVSRTFALNIKMLSGDLHWAVLDGYLICRTLDTVEDASGLSAPEKIALLHTYLEVLQKPSLDLNSLHAWQERLLPLQALPHETDLLSQAEKVLVVFFSLPESKRKAMLPAILTMGRGMADFLERGDRHDFAQLRDEKELEEYCYIVAGTVGEMLTALFSEDLGKSPENAGLRVLERYQIDFGLGLQLTNILKDWAADRQRKWCYIPKSEMERENLTLEDFYENTFPEKNRQIFNRLYQKTARYLQNALEYTLAIPATQIRKRWFCALPLLLAAETLAHLKRFADAPSLENPGTESPYKISRRKVKILLWLLPIVTPFNWSLRLCFEGRMKSLTA